MRRRQALGQTLVEVVVALGLMGVDLVALAAGATLSIKNARVARERAAARVVAGNVLEGVRATRDSDPETFFSETNRTETLAPEGTNPEFAREVTYTVIEPGQKIRVEVVVSWGDGNLNYQIEEVTELALWQ